MSIMSFRTELKEFLMRGNVVDMAVGIVIGAAFGKIVTSLVSDLLMPLIGAVVGGINFTDWKWTIVKERASMLDPDIMMPAVTLNYGNFLQVLFDFIIVALCIFILIKGINRLTLMGKKKEEAAAAAAPAPDPKPTKEEVLLTEIRDLLKNK